MKYMPILPIGLFSEFRNPNAFILPQFWRLEEYSTFYKSRPWDTVIIDNAMYEHDTMFDFKTMIAIASKLNASKIFLVVPEDKDNPANTVQLACDCISDHPPESFWKPMCILHGDPSTVKMQFNQLKVISSMGFGMAVSLWRAGYNRSQIYKDCKMSGRYVHAMGLDNIDELVSLREAGFNSVDSSIAASAAWNNINLNRYREIIRTGSPDDPVRVPINHQICSSPMKLEVMRNIELINSLCEG